MNDLRTAAQQALEALENSHYDVGSEERQRLGVVDAITALRAALAEPVQEPTLDDAMALPRALAEAYERGWRDVFPPRHKDIPRVNQADDALLKIKEDEKKSAPMPDKVRSMLVNVVKRMP